MPAVNSTNDIKLIDFASNDYLCLSQNKDVLAAAVHAGRKYGVGSTGSRLLLGNSGLFEQFETQIAWDKKSQSALIFNSGFQANITVLASLLDTQVLGSQALVFADKLIHASLYQGIFLARAELIRYHPQSMDHLSNLLIKYQNDARPKFIVTESVFGMDGSMTDLTTLLSLCQKYHAFLYLDEAHATGIFGEHGYGLSTTIDLKNQSFPYLVMGTFSKALGCSGAYVTGSLSLKKYLINKCSGFIYTTALSPLIVGAAAHAWSLVPKLTSQRAQLLSKSADLRLKLQGLGFDTGASVTHIIPVILGSAEKVLTAQKKLKTLGIRISAIRPPTVSPNTSRLRIALNVDHTAEDIDTLIQALRQL
ncbi:MAG: aminotransferase class I/II-fold pyridoxal phosphate-dependent enzyme [Janthinobacterium lividum]